MADKSGIQWTDATWNPTTGCDRVSPGCANCYALTFAPRLQAMAVALGKHVGPTDPYMRDGDPKTSGVGFGLQMHTSRLDQPLRWKRPRRIFVNSMSDLFHPEVTDAFIGKVFGVMSRAPQHVFQVLTKRPERMREWIGRVAYCEHGWLTHNGDNPRSFRSTLGDGAGTGEIIFDGRTKMEPTGEHLPDGRPIVATVGDTLWPLPNVWLGTSVENARWRTRIDELRQTPAAVRFLSCEPLLGPLTLPGHGPAGLDLTGIDWVIVGGESGVGARPMSEDWVRDIVAECRDQGVAPFVKQMGQVWAQERLGHSGHAGDIARFPVDLQVREWPGIR